MSHPPFFFILARLGYVTTGQCWGIRLPSVIFGLGTVCLFPFVTRRMLGRGLELPAMWFCATAPFLVEFAGEGRPYSVVMFFSLAYLYALWGFLAEENWPSLALLAVISLGGLATHHFFGLQVIFGGIYYLAIRKRLTRYSSVYLAMLILLAAITAPLTLKHAAHVTVHTEAWSNALNEVNLPNFLARLTIALTFGYCTFELPELGSARNVGLTILAEHWQLFAATFVWLAGLGISVQSLLRSGDRATKMSVLGIVVPLVIALLASTFGIFLIREKYMAIVFPAMAMLNVSALAFLSKRKIGRLCIACYLLVIGVSLVHYVVWPNIYSRRSDWAGLVNRVNSCDAHDRLVFFDLPDRRFEQLGMRVGRDSHLRLRYDLPGRMSLEEFASKLNDLTPDGKIFLVSDEAMRNAVDKHNLFAGALMRLRASSRTRYGRNLVLWTFESRDGQL